MITHVLVLGHFSQFWYIWILHFGIPIEIIIMFPCGTVMITVGDVVVFLLWLLLLLVFFFVLVDFFLLLFTSFVLYNEPELSKMGVKVS